MDLPFIIHVYNESIPGRQATADLRPVSVASKKNWFKAHNQQRPLWLINDSKQKVGWIGLESFYGRPAYCQTAEISIYIDYRFHHRGIGKVAIQYVIKMAPKLKLHHILAFIFSHNKPSQKVFKDCGFVQYGHLPNIAIMDRKLRSLDILGKIIK